MSKVLLLSPHTDDVELGAGATVCKMLEQGYEFHWIVFSTAEDALPEDWDKDFLEKEFLEVVAHLDGLFPQKINHQIEKYKVRRLSEYRQDILDKMIKVRKSFSPDIVIGPSLNDYHQDHQVIANEMVRAFKTNSSIICYELPWNHIKFDTQLFVELEEKHVELKCKLLEKYNSQISLNRQYFNREYVYGLANVRGTQIKSKYAEAFEVVRWIV